MRDPGCSFVSHAYEKKPSFKKKIAVKHSAAQLTGPLVPNINNTGTQNSVTLQLKYAYFLKVLDYFESSTILKHLQPSDGLPKKKKQSNLFIFKLHICNFTFI